MMSTGTPYEAIVVGSGSMGLAAGYYLSKQGVKVLLLDPHEPPHTFGSHHGSTRLIRIVYAEGASYIPLALRARQLWIELEQEWTDIHHKAPDSLFAKVGVLNIMHPRATSIAGVEASVREYGLPCERLTRSDAMSHWPGLAMPEGYIAQFDPQGGVLFSERCLLAYKELCLRHGAATRFGGQLDGIKILVDSVEVSWNGETFQGQHLLLCTGAGTPAVLKRWFPEWELPMQPLRKVFAWYKTNPETNLDPSLYRAPQFPGFCVETQSAWFYGFPDFGDGVKVGRHDGGIPCTPGTVDRTFHAGEAEDLELHRFLAEFLPGNSGPLKEGKVCMYTMTPDEDFLIGTHPGHPHVHLAAGFSGHGFKFASAVGEVLAQMVTEGQPRLNVSHFRPDRF
jgi:N-methyl-L-tryptophan oxidase